MLGNVISINNIYQNLQDSVNAGNTTDVVLQVSKIFRIIIDFDPVEFSSLSTPTPSALQQQPSNPWQ